MKCCSGEMQDNGQKTELAIKGGSHSMLKLLKEKIESQVESQVN